MSAQNQMEYAEPTARPSIGPEAGLLGMLTAQLNRGELLLLCHRLTVDYEALPGGEKPGKVRALVVYLEHRGRTAELVDTGKLLRPDLDWDGARSATEFRLVPDDGRAQPLPDSTGNNPGGHRNGAEAGFRWGTLLFLVLIAVVVLGSLFAAATAWASQAALPGDSLYNVKLLVEDGYRLLAASPRQRAELELRFAARRLEELQACALAHCGSSALTSFDLALSDAILALLEVSPDEAGSLYADLATLAGHATTWLGGDTASNLQAVPRDRVFRKAQAVARLAADPDVTAADLLDVAALNLDLVADLGSAGEAGIDPHPVPFPNMAPEDHPFPLEGAHVTADCWGCHAGGTYRGTPDACTDCHFDPHQAAYGPSCERCHSVNSFQDIQMDHAGLTDCQSCHAQPPPPNHFAGRCQACHVSVDDWLVMRFDHAGLTDCQSCHAQSAPSGHYAGQCSRCHVSVEGWLMIQFSHSALTDCQNCHTGPADHYAGQCSQCHASTILWSTVQVNHTGLTNCQSCHARPSGHYGGQCSQCHTGTTAWSAVSFNHSGFTDCQGCHTRPSGHYGGQCSQCHTGITAWSAVRFDHAGFTDCQGCHSRPSGHYRGQCSQCHTGATAWSAVSFSHAGLTDCQSCHTRPSGHYGGQCSQCHTNIDTWSGASFSHAGLTDCQGCHTRPSGHYGGQCSQCHTNTNTWSGASFSHAGLTDCQSCHARPPGHYGGQCSQCHTSTDTWSGASFSHAGLTECQGCHTQPSGHYSGQCSQCHNTSSWGGANPPNHTFPINHRGAGGECSVCHPSGNYSTYTCEGCHSRSEMESEHGDDLGDISNCVRCHPTGREPHDD